MSSLNQVTSSGATIRKTLLTAKLFDRFWDRWFVHGIAAAGIAELRRELTDISHWIEGLQSQALQYQKAAAVCAESGKYEESEHMWRTAGLYYYLIQWIYPEVTEDKRYWFERCKAMFENADRLSEIPIIPVSIPVKERECCGRMRIPESPHGCVVLVSPIDSSKEELFTYESEFVHAGFATLHVDGPGQGETLLKQGLKASRANWTLFIRQVIDEAAGRFPGLPIFLFGTSSGASWAVHGSFHPKVEKAAAVSPAFEAGLVLPEYFLERMACILEDDAVLLPELERFEAGKPVMLFHGKKDTMVKDEQIYALYGKLPEGKRMIEYENEGHCCNFKLGEIRKTAAAWFMEGA
ncbi:alpha/beta hydrolase [Paenibacillus chartarius]|uniref:Alpha/beta hydrolase n=1 Tax=Paenibacillus chartarius TaxID=747481 RepID=A0ABV6DLT6_9BACL